jgi:hypothetical protein
MNFLQTILKREELTKRILLAQFDDPSDADFEIVGGKLDMNKIEHTN